MRRITSAGLAALVLSACVVGLTGCASMANTGVNGVSFGMSPQSVTAKLPATDQVIESSENEIVTRGPSDRGDMRIKTFTFVDGHLHCVRHQYPDDERLKGLTVNLCE